MLVPVVPLNKLISMEFELTWKLADINTINTTQRLRFRNVLTQINFLVELFLFLCDRKTHQVLCGDCLSNKSYLMVRDIF